MKGKDRRLKVLILDFDGVIVESNAVKTEAFEHMFRRFPELAAAMMEFHRSNVSMSRFGKFEHLARLLGREGDAALQAELSIDFSNRLLARMMEVPLVRGAEPLLAAVTRRMPVYLASVTPADELTEILRRRDLAKWFVGVYGCPPWTKINAIKDVLAREMAGPREALLIGDSSGDQRAAGVTGIGFLGRDSGLEFDEPLPVRFADLTRVAEFLDDRLP